VTDNVLVRAEYLHDEYSEEEFIVTDVTLVSDKFEVGFTDNIFRVGVSWKFMGGMAF
jgi:opacity protein-like surface antigen